jgi:excisionase family DNA binding protein
MNVCPTCGRFNLVEWAQDISEELRQGHESPQEGVAVSIDEAARLLGIRKTKFLELVAAGEIPVVKIGTRTVVRRSALEEYLRGHETGGPAWQSSQESIVHDVFGSRTARAPSTNGRMAASKRRSP